MDGNKGFSDSRALAGGESGIGLFNVGESSGGSGSSA